MKKMIFILLATMLGATLLVGCGDKKDTPKESQKQEETASKNKLTESDKNLLKKSYFDFNGDERTQFAEIEEKFSEMTSDEKKEYLKDFERLEKEKEIQVKKWEKEEKEKEAKEEEEQKEIATKDSEVVKNVVKTYFSGWKEKDYAKMYEVSQESWKSRNKEDLLEAWYDFKDLKSYKIIKISGNDTAKQVSVECEYDMGSLGVKKCTIIANVINENGEWGINPTSTLKEE